MSLVSNVDLKLIGEFKSLHVIFFLGPENPKLVTYHRKLSGHLVGTCGFKHHTA